MSVIIKGMEMPTNCGECPMICEYDLCCITKGGRTINGRPPHCPLIEVPKHGDLIDRDAAKAHFKDEGIRVSKLSVMAVLNNAQVIIKAEPTCNDCKYSLQNCKDKSICCEMEDGLCDDYEEVEE